MGVDFISVSFVRKGEDIEYVRDLLCPRGEHIKIIAKIENLEGMENFEDILKHSDGIMVARYLFAYSKWIHLWIYLEEI